MTVTRTIAAMGLAASLSVFAAGSASAAGIGVAAALERAAPQSQVVQVKGRGARNVALGVLGAAAAVAIIAGASKAARAEERRRDDDGDRCGFYDRKCEQGHGWACRKFDTQCTD